MINYEEQAKDYALHSPYYFFNAGLHKKYPELAGLAAETIISHSPYVFFVLYKLHKKYPEVLLKVGKLYEK